jgi:FMN phosphatase YigB (HAD superfamily)
MNKIKVVIFDIGGVLVYWGTDMYEDLKQELNLDEDTIERLKRNYLHPFSRGEITETEVWLGATKELGIRPVALEENSIGRAFAKTYKQHKEVINFVEELKARGLRVAILSNTNEVHNKIAWNTRTI